MLSFNTLLSTDASDRIAFPARGFVSRCNHPGDSSCVFRIERQPVWTTNHNHIVHPFCLRMPLVNKSPLRFVCLYHSCDRLFINFQKPRQRVGSDSLWITKGPLMLSSLSALLSLDQIAVKWFKRRQIAIAASCPVNVRLICK